MESGLGSNLRARLSSALALNIESNQQEMTSELTVNFIMFFMNLKTKSTVHDIFQCNFKILNKTHNKKDITIYKKKQNLVCILEHLLTWTK